MLTIAQITDLHVTTPDDPLNRARNGERLRQTLRSIHALQPRPVAIVATGDLVDRGEPAEYVELEKALSGWDIPIYLGIGNHDRREPFRARMGEAARFDADGFVQYAVDLGGVRLVMIDTLQDGSEGGGFCERRAAWLARTLDAAPDTPTVIGLHHPPIPSGIQWMDPAPDADWLRRLAGVLEARAQVVNLICGHVHRAFNGVFAGQLCSAAAATSIQLTLNLTEIDLRHPDGREILLEEPPGFALLRWDGRTLTNHVCLGGEYPPAVHYTVPMVRD